MTPCCARTCSGSLSSQINTTTCSSVCQDRGWYLCRAGSTYCNGYTFTYGGVCNSANGDPPCPDGYCCIFDTYNAAAPYLCLSCNNPSLPNVCTTATGSG
ncbi:unnamed protein product [Rotaria sordida]|uniref:Uncharacterized protein n=1 Tax=Rotaria sordida TaxID=392033 RepID=A0A814PKZ7_9BILA|nr:unnamed protein product [Rotaria sordida]CAF1316747.1 unnamed protein product [Rotaria sordida]